jgi:hypothetical protein
VVALGDWDAVERAVAEVDRMSLLECETAAEYGDGVKLRDGDTVPYSEAVVERVTEGCTVPV